MHSVSPPSSWEDIQSFASEMREWSIPTIDRVGESPSSRTKPTKTGGEEEMPRTQHTHLPNSVNHAHYALPTTSYLKKPSSGKRESRLREDTFRQGGSSSSEPAAEVGRRRPIRKQNSSKTDQSEEPLDKPKHEDETESEELVRQLQTDFDDLLSKYAMAEVTIDQLRLGAKLNLYSDQPQPAQAATVQPGTARSATTLTIPQKNQGSLNSSLQSGFILPTSSSPRQPAEAGILTTVKPLTEPQTALAENITHLQDQVGSFIAGVSGQGRVLNLKPEIHHQLYEALEQSQDTLHHQLAEEKQQDPDFDVENELAGQLHQIRMSMDDHIDQLPQIQQPPRPSPPKLQGGQWQSDEETLSHTPSSMGSAHSNSTSIQRPKKQSKRSNTSSRKGTPQGSRGTRSYTDQTSSSEAGDLTDNESVKRREPRLKPQHQGGGGASTSSLAGSDNPVIHGGLKSRTRIQGSSDSGFIGSEEGKSPNTPSDRHITGLPTIQSQAETSGVDSPRALTPDLSEERTAEWALRHKIEVESSEPTLPEPPKSKRTQSRSSRKSTRSDRSAQSSLKSEALRSIRNEIEKLRDEFDSSQALSPDRESDPASSLMPKHSYGSPMKATYRPPSEHQSPSSRPQTRSKRPTDPRNSDLDLSEVEGGRGYTPAPPPTSNRRGRQDYPSTDEDPRQPPQNSRPLHESPIHQQQYPSLALPSPSSRQHRPRDQDSVDMPAHHRPAAKSRDPEYERRRGKSPQTADYREPSPMDSQGYPYDPRADPSSPTLERRRTDRPYRDTPSRGSSYYNDQPRSHRPYNREDPQSPDYRSPHRPEEYKPSPPHRPSSSSSKGHRSGHKGRTEMSPISERAYDEGPAAEYYRRYKSPRARSRTMDELDMRDLNQTSVPYDSTVHTQQSKSGHIPPPNAISTPHRSPYHPPQQVPTPQYSNQSQHPTQYPGQSHPPTQQYVGQSQPPAQSYNGQPQQPMQYGGQPTYIPQPQYQPPLQQTLPAQPAHIQPPVYQTPAAMTSYPAQMVMPSVPMQQQVATVPVATSVRSCPSCSGRGILATTHNCVMCGSHLKATETVQLPNQLSTVQITTPTAVRVTNQAGPVVIPVANERRGDAYLTQQTTDGGYVTQSVNVVQGVESQPTTTTVISTPGASLSVPVMETLPSGKVRYYVREYGPVTSEAEPTRSRSSSRRSRNRSGDRHRHSVAVDSLDDLETSLREAHKSAQSLKRISRDMREGLTQELLRSSNHRRSLTSSWNL